MPVTNDLTDRDPIDLIAEEFADRCRRGDRPSVEEYVRRYPDLENDLREILPAVGFLEKGRNELSGQKAPETSAARFGDHRVVKEIGRGGMGIVYEAVQEPLGRRVAVKVLPRPSAADPRSRERFLREAKAVARLKHPHIVPIFSVGEWDNVPYYVMELIQGVGLDRCADAPEGQPARARWVAKLGVQAADALAHAHAQGILHRDVKPANLLVEPSGHLWLADFGLAKLADDLSLTETGGLPGTLRYLAPECLDADGDVRSDVYSLGLTLYELLLGRPAFGESNRLRLLKQVRDAEPQPPRSVDPNIPRDFETIVLKAMARTPSQRYATARELADDLTRFLEDRPILARRVGVAERLGSQVRRNPLVSLLTTATVLLSFVSFYFVRLWLFAPETRRPSGDSAVRQTEPGPQPREDERPPDEDFLKRELPPGFRGRFPRPDGPPFGPEGPDGPRGEFGPNGPRRGPGPGPEMKGGRPPDRQKRQYPPPEGGRGPQPGRNGQRPPRDDRGGREEPRA